MLSSLSLIISSFRFKVRDVQLFLLLEYLEATAGLLTGLISILSCQGIRGPKEREGEGERLVPVLTGAVRTHTQHSWIKFTIF